MTEWIGRLRPIISVAGEDDAGVMVLIHGAANADVRERVCQVSGKQGFLHFEPPATPEAIYQRLQDEGIVSRFAPGS